MTVMQTRSATLPSGPAARSRAAAPPPHRRPDGQDRYTISEVAAVTGLSAHTLRWYERIGLMPHVDRSHTGQRRYSDKDLEWLGFIGKLRLTGMPVADMVRYAELVREGKHTYGERYALLESRRRDVLARVEELRDALAVLDHKLALYGERNGSEQESPLPAATPSAPPTAPPAVAPSSPRTPRP